MGILKTLRKIKDQMKETFLGFWSKDRVAVSEEYWKKNSQKGELNFHKTNNWRDTPDFMRNTVLLFESFGYNKDQFNGKTIIDLGAGSKLRSKFFEGAKIVAIEPMADDCVKDIAWCDLQDAHKLYSKPAEELIEEIVDTIDFAFSINVLDHCFNLPMIVENLHKYLKKGATAFLSFDEHRYTDKMHPLILSDEICCEIFTKAGFKITNKSKGFTGGFLASAKVSTYGHGRYCLNYWLEK